MAYYETAEQREERLRKPQMRDRARHAAQELCMRNYSPWHSAYSGSSHNALYSSSNLVPHVFMYLNRLT